jgi:adenylate kinase
MSRYIILLGPPGAGKGTQAKNLAEKLNLVHISSGNLFREHIDHQTALGKKAQNFIERGELVPDEITIAMIRERLAQNDSKKGAILDGFPRTTHQAEALDALLKEMGEQIQSVLFIKVDNETLIERLSGRRTCEQNGHVYHIVFNPPKVPNKCDIDGSPLYQRSDDKRETVEQRIRVYEEQTAPLIDFYRKAGILHEIEGAGNIEDTTDSLLEVVEEKINKE